MFKIVRKIQSDLYAECGLEINNFTQEHESLEYHAHAGIIKTKKILFRIAKKTPKKIGWFVTIWKRGTNNIITPYDESNSIDFVVIVVLNNEGVGEFIFPKSILLEKNILSKNNKGGKRAIRVYSPLDKTTSIQSIKTQRWQSKYFVDLTSKNPKTIEKIKTLYAM